MSQYKLCPEMLAYFREANKKQRENRTPEERDILLMKRRMYYANNKEKYRSYHIISDVEAYKQKQKEYYEATKETRLNKRKEKYEQQKNNKIICECGGFYIPCNKANHENTNKHILFMSCETI